MSQDREFEKYLEGKTDLSKLYVELPQVELPDHLDAAILAEAHRAVNARPGAKPKRRWTIPLGMVATLFVAVMIALQLPYMLKDADQTQQLKEERMAALMDKGTAEPSSPAPVEDRKIQILGKVTSNSTRDELAPMAAEAEAPAKANAPALAAPLESTSADIAKQHGTTSVVASPAPAAAPPAPAPTPVRAAKRMELRERAELDTGEAFSKEKKSSGNAAGMASDSFEQRGPAAARMAAPAPDPLERGLMQSEKDEASAASLRPEEWLDRIKKLKQEGKLEEAKKELAAFKKRYPDYPVPEGIKVR